MSTSTTISPARAALKADVVAGLMVFLIALPLSLGIAMASGFPPIAGVLTAIIGGVVVTFLGSAELTIKGPAAGLIVIALGAVHELGGGDPVLGYKRALAVGVVAAVVQIILALTRAGVIASIMPPSVVHGMLAAIGVIIIAKQAPVMFGVQSAHGEPLEMLMSLPHYLREANPEVLLVGALAMLALVFLPRIKGLKKIPGPLAALMLTVPIGIALHFSNTHNYTLADHTFHLGPDYLVNLPGSLLDAVTFPDFSVITSGASIKYIIMYALVGSVEGLLSVIAVDAMDPQKRVSDLNRDLLATGVGNLACGMLGGLPLISEIVRSRANIDAGAKSHWANFFHGLALLGFVALLPNVLHQIPLAVLAAMLVYTGARLASPSEFRHALHVGTDQFAVFLTTFMVTLATDLLVGVGMGIVLKLVLHIARGVPVSQLFRSPLVLHREGTRLLVSVRGPAVFTNLLAARREFVDLDETITSVEIDLQDASFVDHTFLDKVTAMAGEWPHATLTFTGRDMLRSASDHPLSSLRAKGDK